MKHAGIRFLVDFRGKETSGISVITRYQALEGAIVHIHRNEAKQAFVCKQSLVTSLLMW